MATKTFVCNKAARVGTDGSLNLGAGACNHLPVGSGGGYSYRSFLRIPVTWTGMNNVSEVLLRIRTSDENHLTFGGGGDRDITVQSVTSGWQQGTASHPMLTSNAVTWGGPSRTATNEVTVACTNSNNTWVEIDVTALVRRFAPSWVTIGGSPGLGNDNDGFALIPASGSDKMEFWSDDKAGSEPELKFTYTSNVRPTINVTVPTNGGTVTVNANTPTLPVTGAMSDADGDAITSVGYEIELYDSTIPGWAYTNGSGSAGVSGYTYFEDLDLSGFPSACIVDGNPGRVRVRASDAGGWGAWSSWVNFTMQVQSVGTPTIVGSGSTVMEMNVQSGGDTPRAVLRWVYDDPNGLPQSRFIAKLQSSDGSTTHETIDNSNANTSVSFAYTGLTHGTTYRFSIETFNSLGQQSDPVTQQRVAKWAVHIDKLNVGAVAGWSTSTDSTTTSKTRVTVQHGSSNATGTPPTVWNTNLSAIDIDTWYWARYWFFAWDGAATSAVSMDEHRLTTVTANSSPDGWNLTGGAELDGATSWYGTRSLRLEGDTSPTALSNEIQLKVGETYVLSGRIRSVGDSDAKIAVRRPDGSWMANTSDSTPITGTTDDFDEVESLPFIADTEIVQVELYVQDDADLIAWFDALKLEVGSVVTPWTPSVLGRALVVDGNGLQVDAQGGGVLRIRGSDTSTLENEVELGDLGLTFWGPLTIDEIASPSTPPSGTHRLYYKSDGKLYTKDDSGTETEVGSGGGGGGSEGEAVVFTSNDTWTKPAGDGYVIFEGVGAGGAGGGSASPSAGQVSGGAGGGAGAYGRAIFQLSDLPATVSITIGAAGAPAAAGANTGGAGGDTVISGTGISTMTAGGGGGGNASGSSAGSGNQAGGTGGAATGWDLNVPGATGGTYIRQSAEVYQQGIGANSFFGGGGVAQRSGAGNDAVGFGAGGGGGTRPSGTTGAVAGGAGAPGLVLVTVVTGSGGGGGGGGGSLPSGGSTGQALVKNSGSDGDAGWADVYAPGGTDVAVADGGTGASTVADALTNFGIQVASGTVNVGANSQATLQIDWPIPWASGSSYTYTMAVRGPNSNNAYLWNATGRQKMASQVTVRINNGEGTARDISVDLIGIGTY